MTAPADRGLAPTLGRIDNVGLAVANLDRVAGFFSEQLGLTVERFADAVPPSASVTVGDQYLYVFETTAAAPAAARRGDLTLHPPGLDHLSFTVEDLGSAVDALRARGIVFEGEPVTDEAWGVQMISFLDPEDNRFFLVQQI